MSDGDGDSWTIYLQYWTYWTLPVVSFQPFWSWINPRVADILFEALAAGPEIHHWGIGLLFFTSLIATKGNWEIADMTHTLLSLYYIHDYAKYTSNSFQFSQTCCARGALVKLHRFQTPAIKGQHGACSSGEAGDLRCSCQNSKNWMQNLRFEGLKLDDIHFGIWKRKALAVISTTGTAGARPAPCLALRGCVNGPASSVWGRDGDGLRATLAAIQNCHDWACLDFFTHQNGDLGDGDYDSQGLPHDFLLRVQTMTQQLD